MTQALRDTNTYTEEPGRSIKRRDGGRSEKIQLDSKTLSHEPEGVRLGSINGECDGTNLSQMMVGL